MASFKSKLFNFAMRNRHFFQFKLKRDVFDFNTSIEKFREQCEKGARKYSQIPDNLTIQEDSIDGMKAEWIIPENSNPDKVILYVHGGGYVSGSCNDHRGFVAKFAKYCGYKNLTYEYRLAPEHVFPAALDDSIKAYEWLLSKGFISENIIIAGESAGGGLCLSLLLALKENKIALPAAAVAISPWTDLSCSSDSYKTKRKVSVAPFNSWNVFSKYYVGNNSPALPLISPLFGNLAGLPPIFLNAGVDDELFDDAEKYYLKAKEAGVDITFRSGTDMVHCYPLLAGFFPEATVALDEICEFIKNTWEKDNNRQPEYNNASSLRAQ
jgi:monoterpene epsilon-lactone hydrolase